MIALMAIGAAAGWGISGFLGGYSARVASPIAVVLYGQAFSLVLLIVAWWSFGWSTPPPMVILLSIAVGALNAASLIFINRAYAVGSMVHAAPVLALAPIVPFVYGLMTGESPHLPQMVGVCLAITGTVLISTAVPVEKTPMAGRQIVIALMGAASFGVVLIGMAEASREAPQWFLVGLRIGAVAVASIAAMTLRTLYRPVRDRSTAAMIAVMSVIEVSSVALYGLAARHGQISLAAVLGSMFPVVTALISVAVLGERVNGRQALAYVTAFTGAALIVVG